MWNTIDNIPSCIIKDKKQNLITSAPCLYESAIIYREVFNRRIIMDKLDMI